MGLGNGRQEKRAAYGRTRSRSFGQQPAQILPIGLLPNAHALMSLATIRAIYMSACTDRAYQSSTRFPEGPMNSDAYYRALMAQASASLDRLAEDGQRFSDFTAVHNYGADFEALISAVQDRPEAIIYRLALKEFHLSIYASASGSYRHAHIGLRLFLELFCAGVFFSAYEIKLRLWLAGSEGSDINWSAISNVETGIFSVNFLRAFNPDISGSGKQYMTLATRVYRECSGNYPPPCHAGQSLNPWWHESH